MHWHMRGWALLGLMLASLSLAAEESTSSDEAAPPEDYTPLFDDDAFLNPAMMTGPVLTTITDITGVSIYLGLSTVFLAGLMASGM